MADKNKEKNKNQRPRSKILAYGITALITTGIGLLCAISPRSAIALIKQGLPLSIRYLPLLNFGARSSFFAKKLYELNLHDNAQTLSSDALIDKTWDTNIGAVYVGAAFISLIDFALKEASSFIPKILFAAGLGTIGALFTLGEVMETVKDYRSDKRKISAAKLALKNNDLPYHQKEKTQANLKHARNNLKIKLGTNTLKTLSMSVFILLPILASNPAGQIALGVGIIGWALFSLVKRSLLYREKNRHSKALASIKNPQQIEKDDQFSDIPEISGRGSSAPSF